MSRSTFGLPEDLQAYLQKYGVRESAARRMIRDETADHPSSNMQIAAEQGELMALLSRIVGARKALEVGVFTGYSALCVAEVLPPDGKLVACELDEDFARTAQDVWEKGGVADRIELRLGPALETLQALIDEGEDATFDFAFVDADKEPYPEYYELCLALLRPGGIVLVDNVFAGGRVVDPAADGEMNVEAIRRLNEIVHADERVDATIIPIADGLTVARKR
jgi:predicted O-methyltransferase YrrM